MADVNEPFWYPAIDFEAYHKDADWAPRVEQVRTILRCEPWQAWMVLLQLTATNAIVADIIAARFKNREPWETDEDEDDDE